MKKDLEYNFFLRKALLNLERAKNLASRKARIEEVIAEVDVNYPFMKTAPHPIQKAVYNMAFNLGITRFSKFKNMIAALEKGNYDQASIEAQDSKWYEQTKSRAERIVLLMKEAGQKFYD